MNEIRRFGFVLGLAGALLVTAAHADQASDLATVKNFKLTDSFLARYQAVEMAALKDFCHLSPMVLSGQDGATGGEISLEDMVSKYDAQPDVHAMLASHNMTAKVLVYGPLQPHGRRHARHARRASHPSIHISAANQPFYEAHKLDQKQGEDPSSIRVFQQRLL